MAQETLEQTQRRLGLSSGPVTNARTTRQFSAKAVPTQRPINARGALRIWAVVAGVVLVGIVAYNVVQDLPEASVVSDEWTNYPGSYFTTTDEVLNGDSLEQSMADGGALIEQLQAELVDYGFTWSVDPSGASYPSSNGYGGDSMLYNYSSDIVVGSSTVHDPDARQQIIAIFDRVMAGRPDTTVVLSNDEIEGEDAVYFFGSEDRDQQAVWSAWTYTEAFNGLAVDIDVYDSTVPTQEDFGSGYWVDEDATGTLFIRLRTSASYLLSESDRDRFIAAVEPYEDETKPDYRG